MIVDREIPEKSPSSATVFLNEKDAKALKSMLPNKVVKLTLTGTVVRVSQSSTGDQKPGIVGSVEVDLSNFTAGKGDNQFTALLEDGED